MKQPAFVFGVSLLAACAAHPKQPLYGGDGSPACGNIGQVGRPQHATIGAAVATVPPPAERAWIEPRIAPAPHERSRSKPLLAPRGTHAITIARPLVMRDERIASGNVMSKGGSRRTEVEQPVDATAMPAPAMDTIDHARVQRPLLTRERRPATGNVKTKTDDDMDDVATPDEPRAVDVAGVQHPSLTTDARSTPRTIRKPAAVILAGETYDVVIEQDGTRLAHVVARKHKASSAERRAARAARRAESQRAKRATRDGDTGFRWELPAGAEDDLAAFEREGRK